VTTSEVPLDQQSRQTMGSKENVNEISKCTSKRRLWLGLRKRQKVAIRYMDDFGEYVLVAKKTFNII